MVTLPTSRNRLHARAIGRDVDVLVGVGAVEHQRVGAGLAFDVSLPSPGFQMNLSSPSPRKATSLPRPPVMTSLPSPPISTSAPPLPMMVSLPSPPSIVRLITPAASADASIVSLPPRPLMTSESLAPSAPADRHLRRQSRDGDRTCRCPRS